MSIKIQQIVRIIMTVLLVVSNIIVVSGEIKDEVNQGASIGEDIPIYNEKEKIMLGFDVTDVVMNPIEPIMYVTDQENKQLIAINYETEEKTVVQLVYEPISITYANDEIYVCSSMNNQKDISDWLEDLEEKEEVEERITAMKFIYQEDNIPKDDETDKYFSNDDTNSGSGLDKWDQEKADEKQPQKGTVAIFNAYDLRYIEHFDIPMNPFDIVVEDDIIYITSASAEEEYIISYSRETLNEIDKMNICEKSYAWINQSKNKIYTIPTTTSPRNMTVYEMVYEGTFKTSYDSPDYEDYLMKENFKLSPDGQYIFNGAGTIFLSSENQWEDMTYVDQLDKPFTDIEVDLENNRFFTALEDNTIAVYDYENFERIGTLESTDPVKRLFYKDAQVITKGAQIFFKDAQLVILSMNDQKQYYIDFLDLDDMKVVFNKIRITLNKINMMLEIGKEERLIANIISQDSQDTDLIWTTSDSNVAKVGPGGVVTALSEGTAIITAQSEVSSEYYAKCTLTVVDDVISINDVRFSTNREFYRGNINHLGQGNGIVLAVGDDGEILSITDDYEVNEIQSGTTEDLMESLWYKNQYIVVGSNGAILSAVDLNNWTKLNSSTTNHLNSITHSDEKYLVVGDRGTILSSMDGINWSTVDSGFSNDLESVVWSGEIFVAVGENGVIITSEDGINWTKRNSKIDDGLYDICWNGEMFAVISDTKQILYSNDGIEWRAFFTPYYKFRDVSWDGEEFIAVGDDGVISISENWRGQSSLKLDSLDDLLSVIWDGSNYIVAGQNGVIFISDSLSFDWEPIYASDSLILKDVIWDGNKYIAVGGVFDLQEKRYVSSIITSGDGINWNRYEQPSGYILNKVIWTGDQYVVVGDQGTILTSEDGEYWIKRESTIINDIYSVAWNGDMFIALCEYQVAFSPDGVYWQDEARGYKLDIVWDGTKFVTVGEYGTIGITERGEEWEYEHDLRFIKDLMAISGNGSGMVAVGVGGEVLARNGDSWIQVDTQCNTTLLDVMWDTNEFIAIGKEGTMLTSLDGVIWKPRDIAITDDLRSIASNGSKYIIVSTNGAILTSSKNDTKTSSDEDRERSRNNNDILSKKDINTDIISRKMNSNNQEKISEITLNDDRVLELIHFTPEDTVSIDVPQMSDTDQVIFRISSDIISTLYQNHKLLEIKVDKTRFIIEPDTIRSEDKDIELIMKSELADNIKDMDPDLEVVSNKVFKFELSTDGKTFENPIIITIPFQQSRVQDNNKVGVYYHNEKEGRWEYIGGIVNKDGTITFKAAHFSEYTVMEYNKTFNDIENHWAKKDIELMASRHIVKGTDGDRFSPNENITRAEFAALLSRALNLEQSDKKNYFVDVTDNNWYCDVINKAYSIGIIKGVGNQKFAPNQLITREEMATMIMRAYTFEVNKPLEEVETNQTSFIDEDKASRWAKQNIILTYNYGIMNGYPMDQTFRPKENATRAEATVAVKNLLSKLNIILN